MSPDVSRITSLIPRTCYSGTLANSRFGNLKPESTMKTWDDAEKAPAGNLQFCKLLFFYFGG